MADTLLQNLDELVSPALTDLLYMVADPAGTPADHKVQFSTVLDRAKGYSKILDASGKGDYTSLSTALAALSAGDVLFIRNGTYAGGVTIATDEITVIGETRNGVIIQSPAPSTTPAFTVSADKVSLLNLKIDGRRDEQAGSGTSDPGDTAYSAIRVTGDGFTADNVWVFEPRGCGISIYGGDDGRIVNCLIENQATNGTVRVTGSFSYAIFNRGNRWMIAYNRITGWSQGIGLWYGASENIVSFNQVVDNYGYIAEAAGQTRSAVEDYGSTAINYRNIWFGNLIDGSTSECIECAQGVIGSQFISNICKNANKFGDNTGYGVKIQTGDVTEPTYDIVFTNNTLIGSNSNTPPTRMFVRTLGAVQIIGNTFHDCQITGNQPLNLDGGSTQSVIRNNTFRNCGGGIRLECGQPAVIDGNTFMLPATTGGTIYVVNSASAAAHSITNNVMDANGINCRGIEIAADAGDYHRITHNTLKNFINTGIDVRRGFCIVTHNFISTTNVFGGIGLYTATAVQNIVALNIVDCNQGRAIYLDTGAGYNVVQENTLIGAGAGVNNSSGLLTNQTSPNHAGTFTRIVGVLKALGAQTVGASQATIAHGLAYTPTEVQVTMTSAGTIWKSAASDGTNIYLTADDADRTAEIFVR